MMNKTYFTSSSVLNEHHFICEEKLLNKSWAKQQTCPIIQSEYSKYVSELIKLNCSLEMGAKACQLQ